VAGAPKRKPRYTLAELVVDRVDIVGLGANLDPTTGEGSHILLYKSAAAAPIAAPVAASDTMTDTERAVSVHDEGTNVDDTAPAQDTSDAQVDDTPAAEPAADTAKAAPKARRSTPTADPADEVRKAYEAKLAAADARIEQVEKALADMRAAEVDRVMKGHAARFDTVAAGDDLVPVFKACADAGCFDQLVAVLDAAKARIDQSGNGAGLLGEIGTTKSAPASGDATAELNALAERIVAEKGCSIEVARTEALERNPALYKAYMADHPARPRAGR
jgi:hypothetical protein